jgi:hypothetical protein
MRRLIEHHVTADCSKTWVSEVDRGVLALRAENRRRRKTTPAKRKREGGPGL